MAVNDPHHNDAMYALAIERKDYRRAVGFAIRGLRRARKLDKTQVPRWTLRLCGSLKRRHG